MLDDCRGELVSTMWHLIWSGTLAMDLGAPITAGTFVNSGSAGPEAAA